VVVPSSIGRWPGVDVRTHGTRVGTQAVNALGVADRIAGHLTGSKAADSRLGCCLQKHRVHRSQALTVPAAPTTAVTTGVHAGG
jgi:hypothetical protein